MGSRSSFQQSPSELSERKRVNRCSAPAMMSYLPVVVLEAWSPVRCSQQGLNSTGKVHKQVAHEEEPVGREGSDQEELL